MNVIMKYLNIKDKVLNEINEVLSSINEKSLNDFVDLISKNNIKVFGYAAGRMGISLRAFIMRLNHLGINAYYFGDTYIPPMDENSIFICCSNSGSTKSVYNILDIFKNKAKGKIVSFVGNNESIMAKDADLFITFKTCNGGLNSKDNENKINSIQPMTSLTEQSMMVLFDIIVMMLIDKMNIDIKQTKKFHSNIE